MLLIGSHVGMSGKEMFLGSVKEALSYEANTFMVYTGAPQNTRRKELSELRIPEARALMKEVGIEQFIVHAPYIINLGNAVNSSTYELAVEFLEKEITRSAGMGSHILVLHPGSHVGEGKETGIRKITEGLNQVLTADTPVCVALETMAGKGSEIGSRLEELSEIYEKTIHSEKLRVCLDTCHMHDAGYDVVHDFDGILTAFDKLFGISQIAAVHLNDSKNPCRARKDRHANLGDGYIGFDALSYIAHHPALADVPKILETPYIPLQENPDKKMPPYKEEIRRLRRDVS